MVRIEQIYLVITSVIKDSLLILLKKVNPKILTLI